MRRGEIPAPAATRAQLHELVANGKVLHGSPVRGLQVLRASETGFLHINNRTGKAIPKEKLLCGTDDPDYAVFFAAAQAPARDERLAHNIPRKILGSSTIFSRDENGQYTGTLYYAAAGTKDFIRRREINGTLSEVYYYPKKGLTFRDIGRDWITAEDIQPEGSLLVSVACLSFDYYQLPEPDSNPIIREYNARADAELLRTLR